MATVRKIDPATFTDNPYIKAIVRSTAWTTNDLITYYMKPSDIDGNGLNDWSEKGMDDALRGTYAAWADVANIRVQEVSNPLDAVWVENVTGLSGGGTHYLPYNRNREDGSDRGGNYNLLGGDASRFEVGGDLYTLIMHDVGHGLGLSHSHDGAFVFPGVTDDMPRGDNGLNTKLFSVMSYNWVTNFSYGTPATPMAFDIAAVQALYGANMTTKTGNDSYVIPTANAPGTYYACIWDAGGTDTVSVGRGATTGATIDLREATLRNEIGGGGFLSSVTGINGGFTIAKGAVIENGTGSVHADAITGNGANNALSGNGGVDTILGLAGNDTLTAGAGAIRALVKPADLGNGSQAKAASLNG